MGWGTVIFKDTGNPKSVVFYYILQGFGTFIFITHIDQQNISSLFILLFAGATVPEESGELGSPYIFLRETNIKSNQRK